MTLSQVQRARFLSNRVHGEDACGSATANGYVLGVVADGVSNSRAGKLASKRVVHAALRAFHATFGSQRPSEHTFESLLDLLWQSLNNGRTDGIPQGADTTMSLVVIDPPVVRDNKLSRTTGHYIAIGDSPIYLCCPHLMESGQSDLEFLCHAIHDRPLVIDDEGRVYSWVDVTAGKIRGRPRTGSFGVSSGDTVLVMTDGIPAIERICRDVENSPPFAFLRSVKSVGCAAGVEWIKNSVLNDPLQDDGAMVVFHMPI